MLKLSGHTGLGLVLAVGLVACAQEVSTERVRSSADPISAEDMLAPHENAAGRAQTVTPSGTVNEAGGFFTEFGTNGRTCNSCHQADQGWSITPAGLQKAFDATGGTDAAFRPFDAANYPNAPVGTEAERRVAYGRFLARGVVRVQLPASAPFRKFTLAGVTQPPGQPADAAFPAGTMSFFRRPLATTNLKFATTVNWDGRSSPGSIAQITGPSGPIPVMTGLLNQSNGATFNHAQLPGPQVPLTAEQRQDIVNQELSFFTAQSKHNTAGTLNAHGANGGPEALLTLTSSGNTFTLFNAWDGMTGLNAARGAVARGQKVFNERNCKVCHDAGDLGGNTGTLAGAKFFDIGISDPARAPADLPRYTFTRNVTVTNPDGTTTTTTETKVTADPGRALFSGEWDDIGKFKAPTLRGLAARPPYFHDGSVSTIAGVVAHYEARFPSLNLSAAERADLIAFLESL
jgi:cytochrome c peroxidase